MTSDLRIGVLALQGSFREHMTLLKRIPGVEAVEVRTVEELRSVSGLIIPGQDFYKINYCLHFTLCRPLHSR